MYIMSEFLLQRPIFDALERYLSAKDLMKVLSLDRRVHERYKDDVIVWYKYCKGKPKLAWELHRLDVIKYMSKKGDNLPRDIVEWAATVGHLEIIKCLHENNNGFFTVWTMNYAARYGHLDIVKFLHENRTEGCTRWAMNIAAQNGHLKMVKWLHENRKEGCSSYAMDIAAKKGHLDIVEFLHWNRKEGCTASALEWATLNGHTEIVKFLKENRPEFLS